MVSSTSFIPSTPPLWRQPAVIAVLASLGLHGVFAFNLDKISFYPAKIKLPPSVRLVQLSPEQINRVYPAPPPQVSFLPIAPPPSLPILNAAPSGEIPEFPDVLPAPSSGLNFPSQPTISFPPTQSFVPPSTSNLPKIESIQPSQQSFFYDFPPPSISTTPAPEQQIPAVPDRSWQEWQRFRGQPGFANPPEDVRRRLEALNLQPDVYTAWRSGEQKPPQEKREALISSLQEDSQPTENPETVPNPGQGSILARLQEDLQQREEATGVSNEANPSPEGEISDQETAMLQGGGAYVDWIVSLQQTYPDVEMAQSQSISRLYPAAACEQNLEGRALVGVLVGSEGQILEGPELLLATGQSVLDDAALENVRNAGFEAANSPKAYQFEFDFNSENCQTVQQNPEFVEPQPPQTPAQTPQAPLPPITEQPPEEQTPAQLPQTPQAPLPPITEQSAQEQTPAEDNTPPTAEQSETVEEMPPAENSTPEEVSPTVEEQPPAESSDGVGEQ